MKLNRSMSNVMTAAHVIEMRATAKSDVTILKAYKAFQRICDVEKKYSTSMLDYPNTLVIANNALIEIEEAIESVGRHGTKYFEDEFIQNSADILDRSCPDITGQINAMYNNITTLEQLNTIYVAAQAVKDRILMYNILDPEKKEKTNVTNAMSSVSNDVTPSVKYEKAYPTDKPRKHRGSQPKIDINEEVSQTY